MAAAHTQSGSETTTAAAAATAASGDRPPPTTGFASVPPPSTPPSAAAAAAAAAVGPSRNRAPLASCLAVHTVSMSRYTTVWIAGAFRPAPRGQLGRHSRCHSGPQRAQQRPVAATRRFCRHRPSDPQVSPPPTLWRPPPCRRFPGRSSTAFKLSKQDYVPSNWVLPVSTFDFPPTMLSTLSSGRNMTCRRADRRRQRSFAAAADGPDAAPSCFYHNDHPCSQLAPPPPRRFIEPAIPTTPFPRWRARLGHPLPKAPRQYAIKVTYCVLLMCPPP